MPRFARSFERVICVNAHPFSEDADSALPCGTDSFLLKAIMNNNRRGHWNIGANHGEYEGINDRVMGG